MAKIIKKSSLQDSMKSKVEIKQPVSQNQEKISRLVGSVFIGMGVLLVAFGIFSYIKYREEPLLDPELQSPVLTEVTTLTNGDTIIIKGEAPKFDSVFIFVNGTKVGEAKVDDNSQYRYEHVVEDEGEFSIAVAGVKGFPNRYISSMSESKLSVVDRTGPSKESVTLKYGPETNKNTFILVGTAEPNSSIEVKRGVESFTTVVDSDGNFRIEGITLEEGKNVYSVYVKDAAGNQVLLDEKIRVTYSSTGDVNGDAVVDVQDGDIPQAAGTLDEMLGNTLMMIFGLMALVALMGSSTFVYLKDRR